MSGDITTGDTAGHTVKSVNGTTIPADGSRVITGKYGTLTIHKDGTYTYQLDVRSDPDWTPPYGKVETFSYVIVSPTGDTSVSTLNIRIDLVGASQLSQDIDVPMKNVVQEGVTLVNKESWTHSSVVDNSSKTKSFTLSEGTDTAVHVLINASSTIGKTTITYELWNRTTGTRIAWGTTDASDPAKVDEVFDHLQPGNYELIMSVSRPTGSVISWNAEVKGDVTYVDQYVPDGTSLVSGSFGVDALISSNALSYITVKGKSVFTQGNIGADSITVEGKYGTLTVNKNGTYSYVANGKGEGDDVFDYTLTSVTGTKSSAQLVIHVDQQFPNETMSTMSSAMDGFGPDDGAALLALTDDDRENAAAVGDNDDADTIGLLGLEQLENAEVDGEPVSGTGTADFDYALPEENPEDLEIQLDGLTAGEEEGDASGAAGSQEPAPEETEAPADIAVTDPFGHIATVDDDLDDPLQDHQPI